MFLLVAIPASYFFCGNGICVADNLCQCFDGWTGDHCDEGKLHIFIKYSIIILCTVKELILAIGDSVKLFQIVSI